MGFNRPWSRRLPASLYNLDVFSSHVVFAARLSLTI